MSDQNAGEEAFQDDPIGDTFEARFPPEAFEGVAEALRSAPEPEVLLLLRDCLLPEFYFFFVNCPGGETSREERIRRRIRQLEERRNAAMTLLKSGGLSPWTLRELAAGAARDDQFDATLQRVADDADAKIRRLRSSRGQPGRPRKDAFRQLGKDLIRVYQKIEGTTADKLDWDRFYPFAAAACRCLRSCLPVDDADLPSSPRQLRDGFHQIWKSK